MDSDSNIIIGTELRLLSEYNGRTCKKCNLIQGLPNDKLGVEVWYCNWVYEEVNKKMEEMKNKAIKHKIRTALQPIKY